MLAYSIWVATLLSNEYVLWEDSKTHILFALNIVIEIYDVCISLNIIFVLNNRS